MSIILFNDLKYRKRDILSNKFLYFKIELN